MVIFHSYVKLPEVNLAPKISNSILPGFWLGPSLIDGSFQASMALADAAVGIGTPAWEQMWQL
jgi:hypothetical protein